MDNRTLRNRTLRNRTLRNNATSTMKDAAMLLLLCRPLRNAVMFCASEKPPEQSAVDNVHEPWYVFSIFFFRLEQLRHGTIHKNQRVIAIFVKVGAVKAEQGCTSFCQRFPHLLSDMGAIRYDSVTYL